MEPNRERREAVKRKITQYLRRAEEIFTCHLQRALGDGSPGGTVSTERGPLPRARPADARCAVGVPHPRSPRPQGYSSLRLRPVRTLRSAVDNLRRCRVLALIDKVGAGVRGARLARAAPGASVLIGAVRCPQVQVVQDPATGRTFVLKVGNGSACRPPPSRCVPGAGPCGA